MSNGQKLKDLRLLIYSSKPTLTGGGSNYIFVHGHQIFAKCTCTKCTKCVFSCLEVPWIDLLAVANLQ